MEIAANICIYTNDQITVLSLGENERLIGVGTRPESHFRQQGEEAGIRPAGWLGGAPLSKMHASNPAEMMIHGFQPV